MAVLQLYCFPDRMREKALCWKGHAINIRELKMSSSTTDKASEKTKSIIRFFGKNQAR